MDFGDLINMNYGFDAWGAPMFDDFYTVAGPMTTPDNPYTVAGPMVWGDDYGPSGTINLPLPEGQYGPAGTISVPPGGIPYDQIPNFGSYPGDIPGSSGGGAGSLADVLKNLAKSGGRSEDRDGRGPSFSLPRIESPVADRIGAVQMPQAATGAITAGPPVEPFRPLTSNVPLAQSPEDPRGLARLLRAFGER